MHDQPSATELLEAITAFLQKEVVPNLEGSRRFHAIVAANSARIVARELQLGGAARRAECERLWSLLGREGTVAEGADLHVLSGELSAELCRRIETGDADAGNWRARVLEHLRASTRDQLAIDNPKFDWENRG